MWDEPTPWLIEGLKVWRLSGGGYWYPGNLADNNITSPVVHHWDLCVLGAYRLHQTHVPILLLPPIFATATDEVLDNWRDRLCCLSQHWTLLFHSLWLCANSKELEFLPAWQLLQSCHPSILFGCDKLCNRHLHSASSYSTTLGPEHEPHSKIEGFSRLWSWCFVSCLMGRPLQSLSDV